MSVKLATRHFSPLLLLLAAGAAMATTPAAGRDGVDAMVFNDAGFRPDALNPRATLHLAGWRPASAAPGAAMTLTDAELAPYRIAAITPRLTQYAASAPALLLTKAAVSADTPGDGTLDIKTLLCVGLGLLALSASQRQQEKFSA